MNEEEIKKWFDDIGLTQGIDNIRKFEEEIINKHYIEKQKVKDTINHYKNPYPKDVFLWDNQEKLPFNRGRFNEFIFDLVETTRKDILKKLDIK